MPAATAPLSVSALVLRAKQRDIDTLRQLAARAELVDVTGQLIHALQRERGASSVWLASRGLRYADVRRQAIETAEPVQAHLRELFALQLAPGQDASSRLLSLMAWVLLGLDALGELRAKVDRHGMSAHDAVVAFSRLIAGLVELIVLVADASAHPAISRRLVALVHLVQGNEGAGQERAVGAELFAGGVCQEAQQQRVVHLIDAQERNLQVYAEFTDAAQRARWERQQLSPGMARLERLRRTLCAARPDAVLDSQLSDTWFTVCSERISELWQLQVELVQHLRDDCQRQIEAARQDLQDAERLLRELRDNPPAHSHAVDRFLDIATQPAAAPDLSLAALIAPASTRASTAASGAAGDPAPAAATPEDSSLLALLQEQSTRLARMESELEAARRALHERKIIERAKGMLMARLGMTEDVAFRALQKTSMDQNRRLLDVAEATLSLPDFAFTGAPARKPEE
ncbi:nitrate- and nitrite sensing domain-containing protein [Leptothrix discophora]|uniref:Nitrate- and nitrite sensing domain-containing protein n=1 Tax=Leptothrix discophora TaxID=89 RepID=A0ABT9G3P3_LEPDI|nr:nitrate- and nitrite sensing domain-containing protein [Leptothrix discophora]MDP4301109.1 nitrate- and nitrite sensing domain-containing protein [Leptothrix discophora]